MMRLGVERLRFQDMFGIVLVDVLVCVSRPPKLFKLKSEVSK
jgi:hypothetical protein